MTKLQEALRECPLCKEKKPRTVRFWDKPYPKCKPRNPGVCKACRMERVRKWKDVNNKAMLIKNRRWYYEVYRPKMRKIIDEKRRTEPHKYLAENICHGIRQRARRQSLSIDPEVNEHLVEQLIKQQPNCQCCGVAYDIDSKREGIALRTSPSIDRFDPSQGYTLDNIELICFHCNNLKRHGSLRDFERIVRWMKNRGLPLFSLKEAA